MALQIDRQTLEVENLMGARRAQALVRAEALVPGAGRDAIEPLLADAALYISGADVQAGRVVLEGTVSCQAVYRQGQECALRALTAQTALNHVLELPDVEPGMLCRARGEAAHVEARYENGHMVFQVTCDMTVQVLRLAPAEVIAGIDGQPGLQTSFVQLASVRLAAEASELALLTDTVALPAALDARAALMDWATAEVEEVAPDLGGVRVRGRISVATLVASGAAGRPGAVVRYPLALDQLVELPGWLTAGAFAEVDIRAVRSRLEPAEAEGEMRLACEVEARVRVLADVSSRADALRDVYAAEGRALEVDRQTLELCAAVERVRVSELVRGTVLLGENAPGAGTVIAAQARPVIGEWRTEAGQGVIEGVVEARALYMPAGGDLPASAEAELPFRIAVPQALDADSLIDIGVLSVEANALMSDRLELKLQLSVTCETRRRARFDLVKDVEEGEPLCRRPGVIITWPEPGEDAWSLGKRYAVPVAGLGTVEPGRPLVLKQ